MLSIRKYMEEIIGWAGAVFSLGAFSLNSLNLISSQSWEYLGLNMAGCFLMIIYAVHKKAYASWVLNSLWLLMSALALSRSYWGLIAG